MRPDLRARHLLPRFRHHGGVIRGVAIRYTSRIGPHVIVVILQNDAARKVDLF